MAPRGSLLLLALLLLLSCSVPRGRGQHWSHGWYPGGKRDLRTPTNLQVGCPPRVVPLQGHPFPLGGIPCRPRVMPTPVPSPLGRCRPFPCPLRREEPLPVSGNGAGGSWRDPQDRD
uniref:Progonadoliberin n=1 Tax=Cyanoderma ruficeps TaxID=181631 RepID=A0A8C3QVD5_9PASS